MLFRKKPRNESENPALLEAGEKIKRSSFNSSPASSEFKNKLKARILEERQKKSSMNFRVNFGSLFQYRKFAPALAVVLIISLVFGAYRYWPTQKPNFAKLIVDTAYAHENFEVQATASDSIGIDQDSAFIIKSKQAIKDADQLAASITLSPKVEFTLKKISDHEFKLTPKDFLQNKKVYRIEIASAYKTENGLDANYNYSFAFQVKDMFRVASTLPRDEASGVPVNSGIEFVFTHDNLKESDFQSAFSITPAVEGRFEKHYRTMVFVPKALQAGTLYTVNLSKNIGLEGSSLTLDKDYKFQFETGMPNQTDNQSYYLFNDELQFGTDVKPILTGYTWSNNAFKAEVKTYGFTSQGQYIDYLKQHNSVPLWAPYSRGRVTYDVQKLSLVNSINADFVKSEGISYFEFPDKLSPGYYLVVVSANKKTSYVFVQVTDLASYLSINLDKTLIWTNDLKTGSRIANVEVRGEDSKALGRSDQNGVLVFQTNNNNYYTVTDGKRSVVVSAVHESQDRSFGDSSWNYLYLDRAMYKPNDTVNVWGFVRPRDNATASPKEVTLKLTSSNYFDFYFNQISLAEQKAAVDDKGFFSAKMKLDNLTPGYYAVESYFDGKYASTRYVNIQTYQKPLYDISVAPVKNPVYADEKAEYKVKTAFYDGTPVSNITVGYDGDKTITTDQNGEAVISHVPAKATTALSYDNLEVYSNGSESGEINGNSAIAVINSKVMLNSAVAKQTTENLAKVSVSVKYVDPQKADSGFVGEPAPNISVYAKVTEITYVSKPIGQYYDFINKVTHITYEYDQVEKNLPVINILTNDKGVGDGEFTISPEKTYTIDVTANDGQGGSDTSRIYLYATRGEALSNYEFFGLSNLDQYGKKYKMGEKVSLEFRKNDRKMDNATNFLFYKNHSGLAGYKLQDSPLYEFNFGASDMPNVYVTGVWFDGKRYHPTELYNVDYDQRESGLNISIKSDKNKYKPGEEAKLDFVVTDKNGDPVSATLNIDLVDKALVDIGGKYSADPLGSIYFDLAPGEILRTQTNNAPYTFGGGGAERGGGDGSGPRQYFPDMPLFQSLRTDGRGRGSLSFKLPDNITSWVVTAQGISDDIRAGVETIDLPVSLPAFVESTFPEELVSGDEADVKVRAYGDALHTGDTVQFGLEVEKENKKFNKAGQVFVPEYFQLGPLGLGEHKILTTMDAIGNKDSVRKTLRVVDSRLTALSQEFYDVKDGMKVEGNKDGMTQLYFSDKNRGQLYYDLLNLYYTDGMRVDQRFSKVIAGKLLEQYFEQKMEEPDFDGVQYQDNGGVTLLPYSSTELELSAKVAAMGGDGFDKAALANYFYKYLNAASLNVDEVVRALYGLSGLDEPVLLPIQEFAKRTDLSVTDKLYLGLAAENIGDDALARSLYNSVMSEKAETLKPYVRVNVGKNDDLNVNATVLAAILAAGIDDKNADALWKYAEDRGTKDILINFEKLMYLKGKLPNLKAGPSSFTITVDGRPSDVKLDLGDRYMVSVTGSKLSSVQISNVKGDVGLVAYYEKNVENPASSKYLNIERHYYVKGVETNTFKQNDIVEIRLKMNPDQMALKNNYEIVDILPSGLQILSNTWKRGLPELKSYPLEVNGNKIKFGWWPQYDRKDIVYYARVVGTGKYVAEPAMMVSLESADQRAFSVPSKVTINP